MTFLLGITVVLLLCCIAMVLFLYNKLLSMKDSIETLTNNSQTLVDMIMNLHDITDDLENNLETTHYRVLENENKLTLMNIKLKRK